MASKIQIHIADDLDGTDADVTVHFALDEIAYEIDLNTSNDAKLRKALAPFIEHARKSNVAKRPPAQRGSRSAANRNRTHNIREWAKSQGMTINDRGRIPADVLAKYEAAH